jgi:hypothetical protein
MDESEIIDDDSDIDVDMKGNVNISKKERIVEKGVVEKGNVYVN